MPTLALEPQEAFGISKLIKIMRTQGNKLLKNIKIKWISMLELIEKVSEYCTPVVKMALDFSSNNFAMMNFELLAL
jgi:hypothetical protein